MALTFVGCSGAEFGGTGTIPAGLGWTVSGNPTTDATVQRNGSFCFKFVPVSAGTSNIAHIPAAGERIWSVRVAIKFESLPASDFDILKFTVTTGTNVTVQFKTASSRLAHGISSTPTTLFGPNPIVIHTWYLLEVVIDRSGATAQTWARIDGGTINNVSLVEAATDITAVRLGDGSTAHANGTNGFYGDDWAYAKATAPPEWIGDGQVVAVKPAGVGTHSLGSATFRKVTNETTPSATTITAGDTDSHTYIDDWPLLTGTAGDWIDLNAPAAPAGTEYVEHTLTQGAVGASDTINIATARAAIRNVSATTANVFKVRVVDGANNRDVFSGSIGSASTVYKTLAFVVANLTALNALKLRTGLSTDASPVPWLQAFLLEVDYAPSATTPKSDTDANSTTTEATSLAGTFTGTDSGTASIAENANAILAASDASGAVTEATVLVILGADANGTVTEVASVVVSAATPDVATIAEAVLLSSVSSDANAAVTEIVAQIAAISAADTSGAAESSNVTVPVSASDSNGAVTETPSLAVATSVAEAGTITEAISKVTVAADANGAVTEATSLRLAGTDQGTETETSPLVASASTTDASGASQEAATTARTSTDSSGAFTEAQPLTGALSASDANSTTTEAGNASAPGTPSSSDTGSGSDASTLIARVTAADNESATEAATPLARVTAADVNGTLTELAFAGLFLASSDTGSGTDTIAGRIIAVPESGTATDSAAITRLVQVSADSGSGVELETVGVVLSDLDLVFGSESFVLAFYATVADAGSAGESQIVVIAVGYFMLGGEPHWLISAVDESGELISIDTKVPALISAVDGSGEIISIESEVPALQSASLARSTLLEVR